MRERRGVEGIPKRRIGDRISAVTFMMLLGCQGGTCAPSVRVERHRVATLPKSYESRSIVLSDDRADYAYVVRHAEGFRVVHGDREGPMALEVTQPWFAPRTRKLFYWVYEAVDGKPSLKLFAGDHEIRTRFARAGTFVFSQDGSRWAAVGGMAAAAGAERGPVEILVDGVAAGPYADACLPAFSHDGRHVAYLVEDDAGRIKLVVDGREQRELEPPSGGAVQLVKPNPVGPNLMYQLSVTYLADGSLLVLAHDRDGWAVFRDGVRLASYGNNLSNQSGDGTAISFGGPGTATMLAGLIGTAAAAPVAAWWERPAGAAERWRVVRNGTPELIDCAGYWPNEPPALSADGQHVAYACAAQLPTGAQGTYVMHDNKRYGPYAGVWGLTLSPDGKRLAHGADDGSTGTPWAYYINGQPRWLKYERVWPPRFSPDGRQQAWAAEKRGRVVLFLNGMSRASSDRLLLGPELKNDRLEWIVLRGRTISTVDVTWR